MDEDELPMLLYHGKQDEMIDCRIACKGYEHFLKGAAKLSLRLIDIGHSVNEQQLRETTQWLKEIQSQQK